MCNQTPGILSAQVFAADGVTAVAGKGPLNQGSDYSFTYSAAPNCQLNLTMLTAAGTISPNQRLIIHYQTQMDANTQNGVTLTNVAGAIQWFNGDSTVASRKTYTGPLTNGTPGILDNQDAFTVTAATSDPTLVLRKSGPATMNLGQLGNFGLDVQNTGAVDAWNVSLRDLLPSGATGGMCNLTPGILSAQVFAADGVTSVAGKGPLNQGSDYSFTYSAAPNCQLNLTMLTAAGTISPNQRLIIHYQTQLDANTQNGATLTNVAGAIQWFNGDSTVASRKTYPGPLTNGTPGILDNQDAFTVTAVTFDPTLVLRKSGPATMNLGQLGNFGLDVQNIGGSDAWNVALRDLLPSGATGGMCSLPPAILSAQVFAADGVTAVAGKGPLNQGSDYSFTYSAAPNCQLNLTVLTAAGTISPNQRLIIHYQTQLDANSQNGVTLTNIAGAIQWFNGDSSVASRKTYPGPLTNGTPGILDNQDAFTLTVTGVDPTLVLRKTGPATMNLGQLGNFGLDVQNIGGSDAYNVALRDLLPTGATGGMCSLPPAILSAQVFAADGVTAVAGKGPLNQGSDYSFSYSAAPNCQLNITVLTAAGTISPNQRLIIHYQTQLDANTQNGVTLTNIAGAIQWFNGDSTVAGRKTYTGPLTNGTPGILDNQDAFTVTTGVVGVGQQVSISEQVSVVGGGAAVPGAQLDYVVSVTNTAAVPAINVVITDDLNATQPGQLTYVSATANASASGVSFAGSTITANYGAVNGPLAPGGVIVLKFRATLNPGLAGGTVVTNTSVAAWNSPTQTASASVSIVVGSLPGLAVMSGSLWYDANFDSVQDSTDRALAGWSVDLYSDNKVSQTVQADSSGAYRIVGVAPNDITGVHYELRFRAPGAGANTATLGRAASAFTNGLQRISDIVVKAGANLQGLNMPIHPNGVMYNSVARTPIAGATLNLLDGRGASPLPAACFDDAAQQGQITLGDGYYRFDINFSDPACPSGGDYLIGVTSPAGATYVAGYSQIIPPTSNASTAAFSVPACPGSTADAVPSTMYCEAQPSAFAPATSVQPRTAGTTYYVHLKLDGSQIPGSSQIFNNHIPLDPQVLGLITITKTTPVLNVSRGQLVPYTITANNHSGQMVTNVGIVDRFPAGFTYVKGSALLDGVQTEPTVAGLTLSWNGLTIAGTQVRTVKVLFAVGAGVNEGEFVNRAQALNGVSGAALSGEATATVRLVPDPTFDCTDVMGKVFDDKNRNGRQDDGEEGLAGVRVVTPTGLQATTDKYGRYHITCAIVPNESRGSNFVLKLDDRTLPSGYRMSTDQVQIQRATSGKALQVNFGASIDRVVSLDLLDAAFEPGMTEIRVQWKPRLNLLLEELRKAPAVLRLSYVADTEDAALVKRRVEAVKRQLTESWGAANSYVLTIEPEVFWRRGAPPKQPEVHLPKQVTK
jgi:large repetitive protein